MAPMSPQLSCSDPFRTFKPSRIPSLPSMSPQPPCSFHKCKCISNNQSSSLLDAPVATLSTCMSTKGLLSGSSEIPIQILASCDSFAQVVALSSTCRDIPAVWTLNASPVLDCVARQCIPAFDEAVVVVGDHPNPFRPSHFLEIIVLIVPVLGSRDRDRQGCDFQRQAPTKRHQYRRAKRRRLQTSTARDGRHSRSTAAC